MGHGKETPRQKMIGMMYLVLTALLALNVSAEILNAFVLVDSSLGKTAENFQKKNEGVYAEFDNAYAENPGKAGEWKEKADLIRVKTQELFDTIQGYKKEMVKKADGIESQYLINGNPKEIQKKDENNIPSEIMILNQKGIELKGFINEYRDFLISLVDDTAKYSNLINSMLDVLSTADMENTEGLMQSWEVGTFQSLPLAGATTMLSKIQTDIRNAEADMLAYLFTRIDAGSFKFNKIEAIVKASSNYIILGNTYEAEVFLAASDTTVTPEIKLSGGSLLKTDKTGKGIYTQQATEIGFKKWGGVINMQNPATGEIQPYPFEAEYQIAQPSLVVSPTKMNVFYIGVDNPVNISVSGVPEDKITASIVGAGSIQPDAKEGHIVRVKTAGKVSVKVIADFGDGAIKDMGSKEFRVKEVPDPVAKVADLTGGVIKLGLLKSQTGVAADLENFDFDLKFVVQSFTLSATINGYTVDEESKSYRLTSAQKELLSKLKAGGKVYFENIKAMGPDKKLRALPSISFKLN